MKENSIKNERSSIEEDIKILEEMIENANIENMDMNNCFGGEHIEAIEYILSDYKRILKINEVLLKENEELHKEIDRMKSLDIYKLVEDWKTGQLIPIQKIKDIIDRIDYDIKKTKEIISNEQINNYRITRLKAMNTKSLDIKNRLQELLESEE